MKDPPLQPNMKLTQSFSSRFLRHIIATCLLVALFLAACAQLIQPTPTPAPAPTAKPTATLALAPPPPPPTQQPTSAAATPPATQYPVISRIATGIPTAAALFDGPTPTLAPEAERASLFDEVWQTVEKNYVYIDFHGADWNALREKYR